MLGKEDKTMSNQDSSIRNPLSKTLLKLFVIAWAVLVSKVYDTETPTRRNKQSQSPILMTRLQSGRKRQPKCHSPPWPTICKCDKPHNAPGRHLPLTKRPPHGFTTVEEQTWPNGNQWRVVQRPPTHHHGRQRSKKGGDTPYPLLKHCRTPRGCQNPRPYEPKLLVAKNETLHHRVHTRMHDLPIMQKYHNMTKTTTIPHHNQPRSPTFWNHSPRLHYQTTLFQRIWLNPNDNQPQLLKGILIPPMQRNCHRRDFRLVKLSRMCCRP